MNAVTQARMKIDLSQRKLANHAKLSFRTVQLMEDPDHNWNVESMRKLAEGLGLPGSGVDLLIDRFLRQRDDSVMATSMCIVEEGFDYWDHHFPRSVYAYREEHIWEVAEHPPVPELDQRLRCLYAAAVEAMSEEAGRPTPEWCGGIGALKNRWYFEKTKYFKQITIEQSPAPFRRRNIFVMPDFLDYARKRR